ncbi:hypothetical protein IU469_03155 [Nocardia puris]|nr:hypothetical protein [Nocardia puris]
MIDDVSVADAEKLITPTSAGAALTVAVTVDNAAIARAAGATDFLISMLLNSHPDLGRAGARPGHHVNENGYRLPE